MGLATITMTQPNVIVRTHPDALPAGLISYTGMILTS